MVAPCCGPGVPGNAVKSGRPSSARFILSEVPSTRIVLDGSAELRIEMLRLQQASGTSAFGSRFDATIPAREFLRHSPARRRTRGRRAPAHGRPARSCGSPRRGCGPMRRSLPKPRPCRLARSPRVRACRHAAHAVVHQDVGGACRARAAVGADHAIGGERDLDLRRFEPLVEKIGRALREDFDQARDLAGPRLAEPRQQLQVFDEIARASSAAVPAA